MRHHFQALGITAFLLLSASCSKEESTAPAGPPASYSISDFSLLDSGNYWVYERVNLDSNGSATSGVVAVDTMRVLGDTSINGTTYAVRHHTWGGYVEHVRDSADFLVDGQGHILFAYGTFDQVIWTETIDQAAIMNYRVSSQMAPVSVPAGTFSAYELQAEVTIIDPNIPTTPPSRYPTFYWSPGVGRIQHRLFYALNGTGIQWSLVSYQVN